LGGAGSLRNIRVSIKLTGEMHKLM
jgi:hypothetical protein